jgi:uncharacterized membrane protein HdeD (DUF308 family)
MIRLLLLLLGTRYVRHWWPLRLALGVAMEVVGIALFIDAIDGVLVFPLRLFGALLVLEGIVMMVASTSSRGMQWRLLFGRGLIVTLCGALVWAPDETTDFVLAMIFGIALALDGVLRIASGWVVRFEGWRVSLLGGAMEVLVAAVLLAPYPLLYHQTVPFVIGIAIFLAGWGLMRLGLRLRRLPPDRLLPTVFSRGWHPVREPDVSEWSRDGSHGTLLIHVWTAEGTANEPLLRPIVNRYIAAVDRKGVVTTGHAAAELPGTFYVSHHPKVDIYQASDDFTRLLRATADNDVPGQFKPSYAAEAAQSCESTWRVRFPEFNLTRVTAWWASYSADTTYNLTNRSCSTTAAYLLETALEGVVGQRRPSLLDVARLAFSPDLWLAGQLRAQAEAMAWTPGLLLDYTRNLRGALNPPPLPWMALPQILLQLVRRRRR